MSFFRRVAPLVLLVVLGLAGLHACSGEEVTHSGVASFRSDIAPAEQSQRQLLLVSEDSTEPPHEVTVTKLEDGSYDVLLKWVLDRTLTGNATRLPFTTAATAAHLAVRTSRRPTLKFCPWSMRPRAVRDGQAGAHRASCAGNEVANKCALLGARKQLSPHALMDVDGGAITSYRGPILLGNMPGNDAPTLVKSPFVLTIPWYVSLLAACGYGRPF
eukprot:scaffold650_cov407-Prasinococcus_capsulatus_cf.AAC.17